MTRAPAPRHQVCRGDRAAFAVPAGLAAISDGLTRWTPVGEESGAVHTGFGVSELSAGGTVGSHVHSFEETVFVLSGTASLRTPEGSFRLRAGDYGVLGVGVPHAWRAAAGPVRWAELQAPQARAAHGHDTYPDPGGVAVEHDHRPQADRPVDVRDPRTRSFGHIEAANMDPGRQRQEDLAVSASMRTALLVYSGISVKMMADHDLGAQLSTMFMVQYEPAGVAGTHDHPFEETYLVLEGEVDAELDGERYRLRAGDLAWAGVGCVHGFTNPADVPVRWLETQAPQPPARHSYRFTRDWAYLAERLPST